MTTTQPPLQGGGEENSRRAAEEAIRVVVRDELCQLLRRDPAVRALMVEELAREVRARIGLGGATSGDAPPSPHSYRPPRMETKHQQAAPEDSAAEPRWRRQRESCT